MQMVMCLSCGTFVQAIPDGDTVAPLKDACPDCSGTEFKDIHADQTMDATEG